ncbi:MAG: hypothetical protein ACRDPM_17485 [Solirubrobacteraceae bacterium]
MPDSSQHPAGEVLDRALQDASTDGGTRRWLLERVALGTAGVAAAGTLGPVSEALAQGEQGQIPAFGRVAVTTEALTVTLLTELLRRVSLHADVPDGVKAVFEGAYAAEVDHFRFTRKYWQPTTTRFWIPDGFFGGAGNALSLTAVGNALVAGETLFVNLYLIGVTAFARAGQRKFARYSAELAGCESEHRVLAQTLLNAAPPNDVGFEVYAIEHAEGIERALEHVGVGFGTQGSAPGAFYTLAHPVMPPPLKIGSNHPR